MNITKISKSSLILNFSYLAIVLLLLHSANVFLFWGVSRALIYTILFTFVLITLPKTLGKKLNSRTEVIASLLIFISYLVCFFPMRPLDSLDAYVILPLVMLVLLNIKEIHLIKSIDMLMLILAFVSFSAFFVFIFNIIGFDPPWTRIEQNFRSFQSNYYKLYFGSIVLNTQVFGGGAITFIRTSGILPEPGHYAVICSALLLAQGMSFEKRRQKLVLLGGFLTFSPFFYIFISIFAFLKIFILVNEKKIRPSLMIAFIFILMMIPSLFSVAPQNLKDRFLYDNLIAMKSSGGILEVLNKRSKNFEYFYDNLSIKQKVVGMGKNLSDSSAIEEGTSYSDYRGFIAKHGIIGLALIVFSICYLLVFKTKRFDQKILIIIFFLLVLTHRSWMVTQIWFPVFIFAAASFNNTKNRSSD